MQVPRPLPGSGGGETPGVARLPPLHPMQRTAFVTTRSQRGGPAHLPGQLRSQTRTPPNACQEAGPQKRPPTARGLDRSSATLQDKAEGTWSPGPSKGLRGVCPAELRVASPPAPGLLSSQPEPGPARMSFRRRTRWMDKRRCVQTVKEHSALKTNELSSRGEIGKKVQST